MTRLRVQTALLGLVLAIVGVRPALAQDEPRVSFSTSVDYSVGDYGTGKDTTLVYVPFTLGVRPYSLHLAGSRERCCAPARVGGRDAGRGGS